MPSHFFYLLVIFFQINDNINSFFNYQITSTYNANSNQINYLQDAEPAYNIGNQSSDNYKYNAIGALIQDNELGINNITWNRFNKPQSVQQGNKKYHYAYSPLGYKLIEKAAKYSNYYVYDATGNVQAQYRISGDSVFLSHHVLYGAKRLGLVANSFFIATKPNRAVFGPENLTITSIPLSRFNHRRPLGRYYTLELGNKQYELSKHLGNVQAVISDRKLPVLKNGFIAKYQADLQSSKEYYPFGMVLYDSSLVSYNYGFNGKPHDFGISSWQDYGFRFYDTRFPRFLSVDPLAGKYPSMAPYVPFANNPILFIDPDGRDIELGTFNNGKRTDGFVEPRTQIALTAFLKTKEGYDFFSQFAKAGTEILGIKFENDGEFSNHLLSINATDIQYTFAKAYTEIAFQEKTPNGFVAFEALDPANELNSDDRFRVSINLSLPMFKKESIKGSAEMAITIGHEAFIHNNSTTAILKAFNSGKYTETNSLIANSRKESGRDGVLDHRNCIKKPLNPKFKDWDNYINSLKSVAKQNGVKEEYINNAKKEHDEERAKE